MTKTPDERGGEGARRGRREVFVRDRGGNRHPFLRGMVTHDLVQQGFSFDDAYATARAVRDRLAGREEVGTAEIRELIAECVAERLGPTELAKSRRPPGRGITVTHPAAESQPFSRGLLARSIHAAGVDLDVAYALVGEVETDLRQDSLETLDREELARRVAVRLEGREGAETAARYRLVRRIQRLPRPLVIYLGGASGTGKSTLALDLAPLLRIYRINATDTIRQVMRMVFSPAILPAIHRSSFEGYAPFEYPFLDDHPLPAPDTDFRQRLTATFEEQATRICVGVRAVVERAIAENMSIVVEGVHLVPPLVPFPDLEGAAYQVPMILTTLEEETHRRRFLARGPVGGRRADRYLESFSSIRVIQDFILQQAEQHDVPLVETSERDSTLQRTMKVLTGVLQQRVPRLLAAADEHPAATAPTLLLAFDGLPDRPQRALGGRTPLEAAHTPNLDRLAREGRCGLADPVAPGVVPDTASGSLALFGQPPDSLKRGAAEALGAGMNPRAGDIAIRGNFATLDDRGQVSDRRAGRIREGAGELAAAIDRLPLAGDRFDDVEVRVKVSTEHRLAILLRGEGLSSAILGSDPGDGAPPGPPLIPRPADPKDERAAHTARLLALFEQEARRELAAHPVNSERAAKGLPVANAVLTRGAGRLHQLLPLEQAGLPLRLVCISGDRTLLGLAGWMGARTLTSPAMTANLDTDLDAKFDAALEALADHDLVVLHVKGADIAAHDRRVDRKVAFIEEVDRRLGRFLERHSGPLRIAVAADHATLTEVGQHAADPVPVLIWGTGIEPDDVTRYDETSVAAGALHRFPLQLLMSRLFEPD